MELELLCTDEDDTEELNEMYGLLCWQGCGNDQGEFKKLMWHGIMKEFNCKVTSTWSSCGRGKEMAFTHRQFGMEGDGRTAQLDYIVGPQRTLDKAYIHDDVKTWDSWDHYPIFATSQENVAQHYFSKRKND